MSKKLTTVPVPISAVVSANVVSAIVVGTAVVDEVSPGSWANAIATKRKIVKNLILKILKFILKFFHKIEWNPIYNHDI